ncbi:TetR/AcrR family transcriptional regulator [Rhodococcus yananensis]|uniref:TetR/AcrR family transcriptional regulator n=1 Tax=Rhodococcus yananensis TaxID=2879464 RepID=UPI001CF8D1FD|nr:TetR/AcrR family transcriptional regulator [Rhodococcus yananensis]
MTTPRPRARLLANTISMVQEVGVHAAGLAELLKRSNTSRNSLYHHFPGGKGELVETATRIVTRLVSSHLTATVERLPTAPSAAQWLDDLFAFWREPLESGDHRLGSFMMAAALDEENPPVRAASGQAFAAWATVLADGLAAAGFARADARATAGLLLSVIEGAIVQSRALQSTAPFTDARDVLTPVLERHLTAAR